MSGDLHRRFQELRRLRKLVAELERRLALRRVRSSQEAVRDAQEPTEVNNLPIADRSD
jgi:hypothetical protein